MTVFAITWLILKSLLWTGGIAAVYGLLLVSIQPFVPNPDLSMGLAAWSALTLLCFGVEFSERLKINGL